MECVYCNHKHEDKSLVVLAPRRLEPEPVFICVDYLACIMRQPNNNWEDMESMRDEEEVGE